MNKIKQRIRKNLRRKIRAVDFTNIGKEEYGAWIDALTYAEFAELISMHDEMLRAEAANQIETAPKNGEPDDDAWIPSGEGMPVDGETRVYVLYRDEEIGGPNPAKMFIWDQPKGDLQIIAYALADD